MSPDSVIIVQNNLQPIITQDAPAYSPALAAAPPSPAYNRDAQLDAYNNLANSLRSDIRDLQGRIGNQRGGRNRTDFVPVFIPGKETTVIHERKGDTVFVKDTLVIKDTVYIRDTLHTVAMQPKTDTLLNTVVLPSDTVFIEKDRIVKSSIDYSKQPATIILFGLNKTAIAKVYFTRLDYVAGLLTKDPLLKANISGHTDKTGSAKSNQILSLKRADAVKNYLLQKGVQESQMTILTFSDTRPVAEGNSKSADSQNRRVEIKLY